MMSSQQGNYAIWKRLVVGMLESVTALLSFLVFLTRGRQHMKQLYRLHWHR
ncbi:hypothetical protein RchiOBHm_Chr7g0208131 [Rosa chinensis]|uniref:Uncharacterized protein n=1 Tax=Rosa chinensis TaxID=74649 RepID=A0A2P6P9L1_ROSCH|nr:hypothetical protein RchiOBHm_Chr7g0208131 [Rosa chinensis]